MEPLRKEAKDNPSASANLLSKIFFCWLNPLFRIGYKRKLEEDDMYNVLPEDASDRLGEELQCRSATSSESNPVFKPRQEQIYRSTLNMGLSTITQTSSLNNSYSDNVGFATPADEAF